MGSQHRGEDQRNDGHQLDEDVHGRAGRILKGIADGIARYSRFVAVGTFAAMHAGFDVFLGVIPGAARVGHHNGHEDAGSQGTANHAAQGSRAEEHADQQRERDGQDARHNHLVQGRGRRNVDAAAIVATGLAFQQARDFAELAADFNDHFVGSFANGIHGHGAKDERQGGADEETDQDQRVEQIDCLQGNRLGIRGEQGQRGQGRGPDGKPFADGSRRVADGVQRIRDFTDRFRQFRHFRDAAGIVGMGP